MSFQFREDTICAIATPAGEGGIGIIKISGPEASSISCKLFKPYKHAHPLISHRLYYGTIADPDTAHSVDEVLLSYMAAPHTYTREDVVEINCHSGYAALSHLLELVMAAGARLAEPGEFTRRAFLNGRIDLSQAEAVIEVIRSQSHQSLLLANRHLQGDFRQKIELLREELLQLQSEIEVYIDFAEDMDEESADPHLLLRRIDEDVLRPLRLFAARYESGRLLREGLTLVLVGKPNVGKSSLLNALLGKNRAIVTPFPGTTRDVIEDSFILSGTQVRILDTAGIRNEPDEIESLGIERTIDSVNRADVVLWLIDQSRSLTDEDDAVFKAIASQHYMILLNKADLPSAVTAEEVKKRFSQVVSPFILSVFDPEDIERLRNYLSDTFLREHLEACRSMIIPNLRHKECIEEAIDSLARAKTLLRTGDYHELVNVELDTGRRHLDSILGLHCDDEMLDRIFSRFCIGK